MTKNIIKEIMIMLLVLVAIALLLGIILYDYIPINKTVPSNVEPYKMSSELSEELGKVLLENNEEIIKTYTVDDTDLALYENENDYDAGKKNPFSIVDNDEIGSGNSNNTNNGNTSNNNTNNSTNNNTNNGNNSENNNQEGDKQGNINTTK